MNEKEPPPSLKDLESRLTKVRQARGQVDPTRVPASNLGQALHLGIEMAACLAVGGGLGWLLDSWLDTKPWLLVVFVFIGFGAGMRNAFRTAKRFSEEAERQDDRNGAETPNNDGT